MMQSLFTKRVKRVRFKSNGVGWLEFKLFRVKMYGKQITESVSQFYETDSVIRFKKNWFFFWNGLQNPFHKIVKQIL